MKHKIYYTNAGAKILGWIFLIIGIAISVISIATGFAIFLVMAIIPLLIGFPLLIVAHKNSKNQRKK